MYRLFFRNFGFPSYIGKPVYIHGMNKISIGKKVRIFPYSRMEVHGENSLICIKDNVSIAQGLHVISGSNLVISSGVLIAPNVFINNLDNEYEDINLPIFDQKQKVKDTFIGENCFIGYGACIQAGTSLGKHCVVGAGAVVKGNFEDYSVIVGNPAKAIKRYDFVSLSWKRTDDFGNFIEL